MEKKLLDESEEVQKLFESFCCKYPVTPDSESQPSSSTGSTRAATRRRSGTTMEPMSLGRKPDR